MRFTPLLPLLLAASTALGQTASEEISVGDRDYAAMNAAGALSHYEQAARANPLSYEAFWKASRSAIDIGSYNPDAARRAALFSSGEQYARRAAALKPDDPEGHFAVARALGKTALSQSVRARIRYATEIRSQALECLRLDAKHAGCLHVMGMWNAEVMRLNSISRLIARNVLGGGVFGAASWRDAVRYMEASVANEPDRIVHHLDLASIYRDVGQTARANAEFQAVLRLPASDFNDAFYKTQARAAIGSQ